MALSSSRVTVTTDATVIVASASADPGGVSVAVRNDDATASIDIGGPDVASGAGFELAPGEVVSVDLGPTEKLYGIAAAGTVSVHVLTSGIG